MKRKKKQRRPTHKIPHSVRTAFPQVEDVVDALRPVEVTVTSRDSAEGRKLKSTECALARAAKREYDADGMIIGLSSSYIIKGKKALRFSTPPSVAREIVSFDRHHDFAPGKYSLSPKSPTSRLGHEWRSHGDSSGSSARPKATKHTTVRVRKLERGSK